MDPIIYPSPFLAHQSSRPIYSTGLLSPIQIEPNFLDLANSKVSVCIRTNIIDNNQDQLSIAVEPLIETSINDLDRPNVWPLHSQRYVQAISQRESLAEQGRDKYQIQPTVKIPKIILQSWKTKQVPEHWSESPQSIARHMSSWKYVLMTDEDNDNFCAKYFPDFLAKFRDFPHNIQRADAIRYLWLYVHGGLYMDLDMVILKPLDPLFYSEAQLYLCSSGNIGSYLTNSFMASKPGCGLWLKMVEYMMLPCPYWCWGRHMEVMNTTGPIALNYVVKSNGYSYLALPAKLVMPCSVCNIDNCQVGDAYIKPLVGSSWVSWDTRVFNFFLCHWPTVIIVVILIIIVLLIWLLVFRKSYVTTENKNYWSEQLIQSN